MLKIASCEQIAALLIPEGDGSLLVVRDMAFRTSNPRMLQIQAVGDQVVHTNVPILILGESGVRKEIVARYIHTKSHREPLAGIGTLWP